MEIMRAALLQRPRRLRPARRPRRLRRRRRSHAANFDTAKFALTYLTWGRYLYNPDTDPAFYHRSLKPAFGPAGPALETALAASSRILPLVTTAWLPLGLQPRVLAGDATHPIRSSPTRQAPALRRLPAPHNVSAISPLDPQLFTTIDQHAQRPRRRHDRTPATTPARSSPGSKTLSPPPPVPSPAPAPPPAPRPAPPNSAAPKKTSSSSTASAATTPTSSAPRSSTPSTSRPAIQPPPRNLSSHTARLATPGLTMSARASTVYAADISYGRPPFRRGHWATACPPSTPISLLLEKHFAVQGIRDSFQATPSSAPAHSHPAPCYRRTTHSRRHPSILAAIFTLAIITPDSVTEAILWYRHVNHGERWLSTPMGKRAGTYIRRHSRRLHQLALSRCSTTSNCAPPTRATLHPPLNSTLQQPALLRHPQTLLALTRLALLSERLYDSKST